MTSKYWRELYITGEHALCCVHAQHIYNSEGIDMVAGILLTACQTIAASLGIGDDSSAKLNCCVKRAYCCSIQRTCCSTDKVERLAETDWEGSTEASPKPYCCVKRAYCCKIKRSCCRKGLANTSAGAEPTTPLPRIAKSHCCVKQAYCCQSHRRCCKTRTIA